jgi:hypothetical protein
VIVQLLPVPERLRMYARATAAGPVLEQVDLVALDDTGVPKLIAFDAKGVPFEPAKLADFVRFGAAEADLIAQARAAVDAKATGIATIAVTP